jgi:hypothetical protein
MRPDPRKPSAVMAWRRGQGRVIPPAATEAIVANAEAAYDLTARRSSVAVLVPAMMAALGRRRVCALD